MILIALGANLPSHAGTPAENLRAALGVLERKGIRPVTISPLYASPAWPDPNDPEYVNGVASVETSLEPQALIVCLHEVESLFGRSATKKMHHGRSTSTFWTMRGAFALQIPYCRIRDCKRGLLFCCRCAMLRPIGTTLSVAKASAN